MTTGIAIGLGIGIGLLVAAIFCLVALPIATRRRDVAIAKLSEPNLEPRGTRGAGYVAVRANMFGKWRTMRLESLAPGGQAFGRSVDNEHSSMTVGMVRESNVHPDDVQRFREFIAYQRSQSIPQPPGPLPKK